MRRGTYRHTDTQTAVTTIHFASATPHAKCIPDSPIPAEWIKDSTGLDAPKTNSPGDAIGTTADTEGVWE